jgi:hypothetical protein
LIKDNHRKSFATLLAGGLALVAGIGLAPGALGGQVADAADLTVATIASSAQAQHPRTRTLMKRQWGVEVQFVRQTAAGYMLEFRYKVLDPKKAQALFERRTKPVLVHPETGAKLIVPTPAKTGALRNSNIPLKDHTYWMFFANPGKLVKRGELVNIEIGDFLADNLVVQ